MEEKSKIEDQKYIFEHFQKNTSRTLNMANQSDSEFEYDPEAFESAHAEAAKSPQLPKEKDDGSDFEMPSELVSLI